MYPCVVCVETSVYLSADIGVNIKYVCRCEYEHKHMYRHTCLQTYVYRHVPRHV